jgi:CubicO group peptidase (beta-lactamase class C family)
MDVSLTRSNGVLGRVLSVMLCVGAVALVRGADVPPIMTRATPESVGLAATALGDATSLLNRFVQERKVAGAAAAVARHGKIAYIEAAGLQDLETRAPMSEQSIFRIYSMTKPVTAAAVMMLWEEHRFDLKDPVSKYLPEFDAVRVRASEADAPRAPSRAITIEDLLLHTSGLNHRTSEVYQRAQVRSRAIALPQFVTNIVRVPLMEDPGTRYRYSEATTVLGRLVEIWSGKPFDVFLERRVFRPLGMSDTGFWVAPADRRRLTTVYTPAPGGALTPIEIETVPFTERPALLEGAVGLVSTVPDYLRFGQMLLNKGTLGGVRLLQASTVALMTANRLSDSIVSARGGIGWALLNVNVALDAAAFNYPVSRGEYGWDGSAGTIFWVDPSLGLVTVLMTQSVPPNPDGFRGEFKTRIRKSVVK